MGADLRLRALDPGRDRRFLERLWEAALGPGWPVLPGGLDIVRDGLVAERQRDPGPGGGSGVQELGVQESGHREPGDRGSGDPDSADPEGVGMIAVDPGGSIQLLLVDPAHQRQGIGTRLVAAGLERLGALGAGTVGLGGGGGDYIWPGVPDDLPAAVGFFAAQGWRFDHTVIDLTADLRGYEAPAGVGERPGRAGVAIEVMAERDRAEVLAFEAATFPEWVVWFERLGVSVLAARDRAGAVVGTLLFRGPPGATLYTPLLGADAGTIGCVGVATAAAAPGSAAPWWPGRPSCSATAGPASATSAGPRGSGSTPASAMSPGAATTWPAARPPADRAAPTCRQRTDGRPKAGNSVVPKVVISVISPPSMRSTSSLNARNSLSPRARR